MDKIEKALRKFSAKERAWVEAILRQLSTGVDAGLRVKRLKGRDDIFRVRKGDIRIIYRKDPSGQIFILIIDRRREDTYKL